MSKTACFRPKEAQGGLMAGCRHCIANKENIAEVKVCIIQDLYKRASPDSLSQNGRLPFYNQFRRQ